MTNCPSTLKNMTLSSSSRRLSGYVSTPGIVFWLQAFLCTLGTDIGSSRVERIQSISIISAMLGRGSGREGAFLRLLVEIEG